MQIGNKARGRRWSAAKIGERLFFDLPLFRHVWKPLLKRHITGGWDAMVFRPAELEYPFRTDGLSLYLHVPFCRQPCPYCPYNRVKYDESRYSLYESAVHREIDRYSDRLLNGGRNDGATNLRLGSLYIGGGTPTLRPASLATIVGHIVDAFGTPTDICVECHPATMDDECIEALRTMGVTMVSIGVESISDRLLELIGRSHDAETAVNAVRRAVAAGFDSVNADIMFALPTETLDDLDRDLRTVFDLGIDQITTYPIFGFPYTKLGKRLGIKLILRPPAELIRDMLDLTRIRSVERGLKRCSVWSYKRPGHTKFSSTTRDYYIGFGPGAASMTGRQFYLNTFSIEEYASLVSERLPVALVMPIKPKLEMAIWLYWRIYEMSIPSGSFRELFGMELDDVYGRALSWLERLGIVARNGGSYDVTESGSYWIHRIQNEYALNYIDRVWSRCREDAWPSSIRL